MNGAPHIWVPNPRYLGTNAAMLERWLGAPKVEELSRLHRNWYGPPIALGGVPGAVYVTGKDPKADSSVGGDFIGAIRGGAGFTSLSDLIAERTAGKGRRFEFFKNGPTGVVNVASSLIQLGAVPPAAANAAAAPGGIANVDSDTGFPLFTNPTGGDTQHLTTGYSLASVLGQSLLLFDCLFRVNKTMNSTATEAVTGVPTRYQSGTDTAADYIGGNFLFVQVGLTALAATAHNWTVCLYQDQASASSTLPSLTGNSAAIVHRLDHPVGQWFAPLETGDRGIKLLTQMQCSALVATGVINFVIGHPIAWFPNGLANSVFVHDGINSAFNLERIFDDAALALMTAPAAATTATNHQVSLITVAG